MKSLCTILVAVLMLHLQCSGSCSSESVKSKPAPVAAQAPCHQHTGDSSDSSKAPRERNSPCSQGQAIEAKAGKTGKFLLPLLAVPSATTVASVLPHPAAVNLLEDNPLELWTPPIVNSVLRI